jgi:hypothetical protein
MTNKQDPKQQNEKSKKNFFHTALFLLISFNFHISNLHVWAFFLCCLLLAFSIYFMFLLLPSLLVLLLFIWIYDDNLRVSSCFFVLLSFCCCCHFTSVIENEANMLSYWRGLKKFRVCFLRAFWSVLFAWTRASLIIFVKRWISKWFPEILTSLLALHVYKVVVCARLLMCNVYLNDFKMFWIEMVCC